MILTSIHLESSDIGIQYNFELFDTNEEAVLAKGVAAAVNAPEWIVPIGLIDALLILTLSICLYLLGGPLTDLIGHYDLEVISTINFLDFMNNNMNDIKSKSR